MKTISRASLLTVAMMASFATSASAADLGGNCCADLEERIAELEATTARKGNRKVSLTVSGWVNQQVTFWDDGVESNIYIHDVGTTLGSHVKFTGSATISPGWSAGYVLHIEAINSDGLTISADRDNGPAAYVNAVNGVQTLQSYWFVKSEHLGKVSVGLQSQASDNTAILVDGSGSLVSANWVAFDTNSFAIRLKNGGTSGFTWGNGGFACSGMGGAWGDCNGLTRNVIRYDSPTFAGFSVSASWGEDDMWDVAARYSGEFGGFKLAAAAAYNETTDAGMGALARETVDYFQAGLYVQHVSSGLFALGNYGILDSDTFPGEAETWYVKAGLRTRFNALGHTVFYGEYLSNEADLTFVRFPATSTDLDVWGLGVVQEIDAAAMSVWIKYRHLSFDSNNASDRRAGGYEDFDYVGIGALINF